MSLPLYIGTWTWGNSELTLIYRPRVFSPVSTLLLNPNFPRKPPPFYVPQPPYDVIFWKKSVDSRSALGIRTVPTSSPTMYRPWVCFFFHLNPALQNKKFPCTLCGSTSLYLMMSYPGKCPLIPRSIPVYRLPDLEEFLPPI